MANVAMQFLALFATWLVLSGRYQIEYIVIGAVSAGLVTFLTHDFVNGRTLPDGRREASLFLTPPQWFRLLVYLPWLLWSITLANLQVAYLVLHPRLPIRPILLRCRTGMRNPVARVVLANSITLTPGTVTVRLEEGEYIVHTILPALAEGLVSGRLGNRVATVYGEEKEPSPRVLWASSFEELEE